jgi:hypothetical protein
MDNPIEETLEQKQEFKRQWDRREELTAAELTRSLDAEEQKELEALRDATDRYKEAHSKSSA